MLYENPDTCYSCSGSHRCSRGSLPQIPAKQHTDNRHLEAALDSEVKKLTDKGLAYGLVVGVYKDGASFIKGYGTVNRQTTTAPDGTTIFQLGSVTKLFTTMSIYAIFMPIL